MAGLTTAPFMSVYDVTKHGVVALSALVCPARHARLPRRNPRCPRVATPSATALTYAGDSSLRIEIAS